jgi:aryl sulfotransferase
MRRYVSDDEDSARWDGFRFRPGDVVVSTRSKSGTTWVQLVCALLVHGGPDLPAPLAVLSPWLDHTVEPVADVLARLEAQRHRRVVKTHTPLDGLPLDERATYVVVARHPLDAALSLYHQGANIDRARMAELTGVPQRERGPRPSPHDWLATWTRSTAAASQDLDSPAGFLHHAADAWSRTGSQPRVLLVHYADLLADLPGEVLRLSAAFGTDLPPGRAAAVAEAAGFDRMRARASDLAPDSLGVLRDRAAFFRSGTSGGGAALLTPQERAAYDARVATMAPPEVVRWLHR